jgi:hypothetical protein
MEYADERAKGGTALLETAATFGEALGREVKNVPIARGSLTECSEEYGRISRRPGSTLKSCLYPDHENDIQRPSRLSGQIRIHLIRYVLT